MATEYKLSYTADEIDKRLRKVTENEITIGKLSDSIDNYLCDIKEPKVDDIPLIFFSEAIPQNKTDVVTEFRYISDTMDVSGYAEFKAQGNSSMSYPKKNMTVKLYKDKDLTEKLKIDFKGWGKQSKYVYKANWIDISHARNIVSSRLWADVVKTRSNYSSLPEELKTSPNQGAVDGFPVKVYSQGIYQGRYTLNIPKDAWMSNMDDKLDNHCILCGENYVSGCFRATANINGSDWTDEVHGTVPNSIKTRWNEVISFVMNSSDEEFVANLENYFFVDSLIDYYIFGLVSCGLDAFGKNQLYFTYDGMKWIASMYDMDSTWGLYWNGSRILASNYARTSYEDYVNSSGNLLYIRLEQLFADKIKERYAELKNGALSVSSIINHFERFINITPSDLVKEDYASTTGSGAFTGIPSQSTNNIQQIRKFVVERYNYCDTYIDGLTSSEPTPDAPTVTGLVYELAEPMTFNGTSDYIDTGVKLYDTDKDFEIMIEFENPTSQNIETLIHCMYEASPWTGLTMKHAIGGFETHIIGSSISNKVIGYNGITRYAIAKINDYYCIKIMHEGLTEPEVILEASVGYGKVDNNLLLGAYQDNSGSKGRFFSGTIRKCKVYFDELPTDEETDAFLMGESTPDEPELPEGVLYSLNEPVTFNGSSDYIDTGVKLYDYDKDFTILADFTSGENTGLEHGILSCMNVNNSIYYGLNIDVGTANNALGMLARGGNGHISGTSSNFGVDCEDIQGMNIKMVIVKRGNTTTVKTKYDGVNGGQILSGKVGYRQFDNTLILGARYDIQHFWNGTINSCVIYNTVLSDEEVDEFLNFTTVEATSDIVWSETPAYAIAWETGEVISGQDYISEMFTLEDGYVYELKQPTGGTWIRYFIYDAYGNFKYSNGVRGDGDLYIDSFGDNRVRITVYPASPNELDLSTFKPVKTDRIWSTEKYQINRNNGTITWNGVNDYFTLQKIPVEGGATYKLSTSGTHTWLSWCEYAEDGTYLGYKETGESPKILETTVERNTSYVVLTVYGGEGNCDDYVTFVKTADAATIIPNIVWSDTSTYSINAANGNVISGDAYVSEPFSIESGCVYSLNAPAGGAWHGFAVYDSDGNFKYYKEASANSGKETLYIDGFEDTVIRLRVWKQNDTLDLSEFSPIKTDRIWSTQKYACSDTGVFTYNNSYDYITLQKIPVEDGATYKLSTTGTHTYLCWKEYAEDGTYLGLKETGESSSEALEATVNSNTTHVILTVYGGESNVDDYVTFVKMADAPKV